MLGDAMLPSVNRQAEVGRLGFYDRARQQNLAPLWRVLNGLVAERPMASTVPAIFRYDQIRPFLMEACDLISTEEAERRVLVLENPGLPGQSRVTPSLFAGLQIILPGEIAPPHRHVASALRFIVEGHDAYTAVGGERTIMQEGDFVITPSWRWHDHGNESDAPMVWLDGLDMHIVNLLSCSFRESYPEPMHPVTRPEGSAWAEAGSNLLPIDYKVTSQTTPIFNYPYRVTREALDRMSRLSDPDVCHGVKMRYVNPATGGPAIPTLSTAMQLLPKGFKSEPYRCTAGTLFSVVEGKGVAKIGGQSFAWGRRDHFVVPSWFPLQLEADSEAVIFSFSDRAVQEKLDIFRERRGRDV
jgi:gentisate 1,2-dioxygenase